MPLILGRLSACECQSVISGYLQVKGSILLGCAALITCSFILWVDSQTLQSKGFHTHLVVYLGILALINNVELVKKTIQKGTKCLVKVNISCHIKGIEVKNLWSLVTNN